jgi:hypothetical protein
MRRGMHIPAADGRHRINLYERPPDCTGFFIRSD